ncbi:hypothetical protein NUW54_g8063 [Trametes sanguinea]|uniref:Uncharacterized protein n=1 Tax=Trametes sanguinea TaxID=158606 RepID=A0ACC1PHS5_9APHY|nr:hypothetical protein NUW54_g8063 [Trametes sanguinea]
MALARPRNMLQWASAFLEGTPLSSTPGDGFRIASWTSSDTQSSLVPFPLLPGTINVTIGDFVSFGVDGTRRDDWLQTEPTTVARIVGLADHPTYGPILRLAWLFRDGELNDDNVTNALGRTLLSPMRPQRVAHFLGANIQPCCNGFERSPGRILCLPHRLSARHR